MTENQLKTKMDNLKDKTGQEVVPKKYHKYGDTFIRPSDTGKIPEHSEFDWKAEMKPGVGNWKAYTPQRLVDQEKEEKGIISDHLKRGWIKKVLNSLVSVATVFTDKKDETKRYCQDYKQLNERYIGAKFPMPNMDRMKMQILKDKDGNPRKSSQA